MQSNDFIPSRAQVDTELYQQAASEPGGLPLKNPKHEYFANLYAGPYWGRGREAAGEAGYESPGASSRLLAIGEVWNRVNWLRSQAMRAVGVDALWITEQRVKLVLDGRTAIKDKIQALRDLENGLGISRERAREVVNAVQVNVNLATAAATLAPEFSARLARLEQQAPRASVVDVTPAPVQDQPDWLR